jgi:hypothetical protein
MEIAIVKLRLLLALVKHNLVRKLPGVFGLSFEPKKAIFVIFEFMNYDQMKKVGKFGLNNYLKYQLFIHSFFCFFLTAKDMPS